VFCFGVSASLASCDDLKIDESPAASAREFFIRHGLFGIGGSVEDTQIVMLVDTGSAVAGVDNEIASAAFPDGQFPNLRNVVLNQSSKKSFSKTFDARVAIGDRLPVSLQTFILDLHPLSSVLDLQFQGIAGLNVLATAPFQLHGRDGRVVLTGIPSVDRNHAAPIHFRKKLITVSGEIPIRGREEFTIDTGMNDALQLPEPLLQLLARSGNAVQTPDVFTAINSDGSKFQFNEYHLQKFDFGGIRFQNVSVVAGNRTSVGMGILRYFTLTVDPQQGLIALQPNAHAGAASFAPDATGFRFRIDASHRMWINNDFFRREVAGEAGLQPGDEVLSIDDRPASQFNFYEARDHFRRAGKQLKLRCRRDGKEFEVQYEMRFPYQYPPQWPPEKEEFDPNAVPSDEN
jgi:hypothetical protein